MTFIPYWKGRIPIFVSNTACDADTFCPSLHTFTSVVNSIDPLTIFVGMFRTWKKFVEDGSKPVGPIGSLTSQGARTTAFAAALTLFSTQVVRISSMSPWQKMKPMLPLIAFSSSSKPSDGFTSWWLRRQVRIIVFLPISTVAFPRKAIRISCICFDPTKSTPTMSAFGHVSRRFTSFAKYAGFFDLTTISREHGGRQRTG